MERFLELNVPPILRCTGRSGLKRTFVFAPLIAMNPTTLRKVLVPMLGTVFAVVTGLLALLVVLRLLELFHVGMNLVLVFVLGVFGALVCSLYTSMCVRMELDLGVVLLGAAFGSLFLFVMPYRTFDLGRVLCVLLATSLANSLFGTLIEEGLMWVDDTFIQTVHMLQLVFLFAAIVLSFSDMTVRAALAVYGVIVLIGWQPLFLGGCALTLIEAKLDVEGRKAELLERGFILYYLEKRFGIYASEKTHDLCVHSAALLLYSYWMIDLLT